MTKANFTALLVRGQLQGKRYPEIKPLAHLVFIATIDEVDWYINTNFDSEGFMCYGWQGAYWNYGNHELEEACMKWHPRTP